MPKKDVTAKAKPKILSYRPSPYVDRLLREYAKIDGSSVQRTIETLVILGLVVEHGAIDGASPATWEFLWDRIGQNVGDLGELFEWAVNEAAARREAGEPGLTWHQYNAQEVRAIEKAREAMGES